MQRQGGRDDLVLDRYRLGQRLGAGTSGSVHAAEDTQFGRSVVVKLFDGQEDSFDAWRDEMRLILRLSHPNIVPCLDIGFDERLGMWILVFARQAGGSLRRWMVDPVHREQLRLRDILNDVASALSFAHKKGVIHRDVKAENVLAEHSSTATRWLLCDFGSGRFLAPGGRARTLAGSSFYMAPEVFTGEATALSDQYSLGVMAVELILKRLPSRSDLEHFIEQHRGQPTIPGIIAKLIEEVPTARYPNIDSFLSSLHQQESTMAEYSDEDQLLTEFLLRQRNQTPDQVAKLKQEWAGQGPFAEFLLHRKQLDRTAAKTLSAIRKGYLVGDAADIRRTLGLPEQPKAVTLPTVIAVPPEQPLSELPQHLNKDTKEPTVEPTAEPITTAPVSATPVNEQSPGTSLTPPVEAESGEAPAIEIEPAEPLKAGTVLDRYSLEEVLGEGASATIYRSYHKLLKIPVAIKVYKREALTRSKGGTERILQEGQMMIRLDHPNIVRVLDISLHDGVPYIVFEYVSEMSLQDLIENIGRLPAERVAQVGAQVAAALAVTSAEGLLHRDVKPEQIRTVESDRIRSH